MHYKNYRLPDDNVTLVKMCQLLESKISELDSKENDGNIVKLAMLQTLKLLGLVQTPECEDDPDWVVTSNLMRLVYRSPDVRGGIRRDSAWEDGESIWDNELDKFDPLLHTLFECSGLEPEDEWQKETICEMLRVLDLVDVT